jgi:hypothetical protein
MEVASYGAAMKCEADFLKKANASWNQLAHTTLPLMALLSEALEFCAFKRKSASSHPAWMSPTGVSQ